MPILDARIVRGMLGLMVVVAVGLLFESVGTLAQAQNQAQDLSEGTPSALEVDPEGWIDPLADAGSELKGWTRVAIPPDGKLAEKSPWSLDSGSGELICAGDEAGHEWLRWDRELGDLIFHIEWRFEPIEGENPRYNSGVYARNSEDGKIWHQAQVGSGRGGFLFGDSPVDGEVRRVNLSKQAEDGRVRPAGEWNTYEITCKGSEMTLWTNGANTCTWANCQMPEGYIGVEAEGYRIIFRNLRVKPL